MRDHELEVIKRRSRAHLRAAREARGLTQPEVAEQAGINPETYGSYERRTLVTSEGLIRLRPVLQQTADFMLGFDDPAHLTVEERELLELYRDTREGEPRRSIVEFARVRQKADPKS